MKNNLIREKIINWLSIIKKDLELGDQGLIKSERLSQDKHRIEDEIMKIKSELSEIEQLKFEKIKNPWRNTSKTGVFVGKAQVDKELAPLRDYLQFLFEQNFEKSRTLYQKDQLSMDAYQIFSLIWSESFLKILKYF